MDAQETKSIGEQTREHILDMMSGARQKYPDDPIGRMKFLSSAFYRAAVDLGVHAFIEHNGFMQKHIQMLVKAKEAGVEVEHINVHVGQGPVKMEGHDGAYLGEKFACVWSPFLSREAWEAFKAVVEKELSE